jgi:biotin/methionine sulfoxide reductase
MAQPELTATHWGNYLVGQQDDGGISVEPVTQDPEPSPIGRSLTASQDRNSRVARPMIRLGYYKHGRASDTSQRGREPFVALDWNEALDITADALAAARDSGGHRSIYGGSYGWASAGRLHHAQSQLHRFLQKFGGYTGALDTYSFAAAEVLIPHILGMDAYFAAMQSPTTQEIAQHCKRMVLFGGAAARNMQVNAGGVGHHDASMHYSAIRDAGIDVVNISPIRDDASPLLNARWLPCRPNSDVASGLGYGSRLAHGVFEALRRDGKRVIAKVPFHVFLRRPTPRIRRTPRRLIADGQHAGAHSAFGRRYLTPIECMSKGNF